MVEVASLILIYTMFLTLIAKRIMTYLHVLQQEDYDSSRLWRWILVNKVYDRKLTFALFASSFAWSYVPTFFMTFIVFVCVVVSVYLEKDPRKSLKKKLVATPRAQRLFYPTFFLMVIMASWCFLPDYPYNMMAWPWIFVLQAIPFALFLVNALVQPFEMAVQKAFWNEARQKIHDLSPTIVGITGSFGKTSIKHILGHILSSKYQTLMTPGSVNTSMGITRIIREQLEPSHKFFLVEMGAYGLGSIKGLCELTPPDYGIIASIGHAHYERFKSLETVAKAKFELAEAVLEKEIGNIVIHERTLKFPHVRTMKFENPGKFVVCGDPPEVDPHKQKDVSYMQPEDIHIVEVIQTIKGLSVKIGIKGKHYGFDVPIFGAHHAHNIVLAAAMAMELGMEVSEIQVALMKLPQIPHRLEVRKSTCGTYTLIDDSYNSNPIGFRAALDLMVAIGEGLGRKILITPGMVELGIAHHEAHGQIGQYAGQICDIIVVVNPKRIPSFVDSVKASGKEVIQVQGFSEASAWLNENKQENDLVLIENDLPDMYERVPNI